MPIEELAQVPGFMWILGLLILSIICAFVYFRFVDKSESRKLKDRIKEKKEREKNHE